MSNLNNSTPNKNEISLKELVQKGQEWYRYLKTKWAILVFVGVLGMGLGFGYAWFKKPVYVATLTFALEEEKSTGGGLAGALGLASSLGIDIGVSAGGAFSGANLIELMKSRTLVVKTLLQPVQVNNKITSIANYFIQSTGLDKKWSKKPELAKINFNPLVNQETFTVVEDSIMNILWQQIIEPGGILNVNQKDKKIGIITIESKSTNEFFAKSFTETIAQVVSEFYIQTKSKKAKQNFEMLQKQTDSVRSELNKAITGVAVANDNTFNLNPAFNTRRIPSTQKQIDVQANTAMLTQLIPNLEMAKLSLRKETPLIQIIDKPVFPLLKKRPGKLKTMILGGLFSVLLTSVVIICRRIFYRIINA